ncbi:MAG: MOSC domain-containing protein [Chloroflexota bacterium]
MSTEIREMSAVETATRTGSVIALAYSLELVNNVAKQPHESAEITHLGVPGDRHYGETRYSQSQRRRLKNDRPITIFGAEATRDACAKLGIEPVPPGGMGENLLTEGLGDLAYLKQGDRIEVLGENGEAKVVFEVQKQNDPCSNLRIYHKLMPKELMGKRGVICTVLQEGRVDVGDRVVAIQK